MAWNDWLIIGSVILTALVTIFGWGKAWGILKNDVAHLKEEMNRILEHLGL